MRNRSSDPGQNNKTKINKKREENGEDNVRTILCG